MPVPTAAWRSTKTFSSRATITGFIKSALKEAIPLAIPTVFRERPLAVAGGLWAEHFSRHQSCHGLAVRCSPRASGAEARSGIPCAAANGAWARALDWHYHRSGSHCPRQSAASHSENYRCRDPLCVRFISSTAFSSSELGGDASRLFRFDPLVFHNGVSPRRWLDARPVFSAVAGWANRTSP